MISMICHYLISSAITILLTCGVWYFLQKKNKQKIHTLKKENALLVERVETISLKTSSKIQIFARLNQFIASSMNRNYLFSLIVSELARYFPNDKIVAILKDEDESVVIFDKQSNKNGRTADEITFTKIIQVFSDLHTTDDIKNSYEFLSTLLLPQNLSTYIYPFALLTEEKIQGYLVIAQDSSINPDEHLFFSDTAALLSSAFQNIMTTNERNFINEQFGQSVDEKVRDYLLTHKDGGSIQNVSVMFFDIRSFTTLSEKLGPSKSVALLNEIFARCDQIIRKNGGFINKFTGDGFIAVFGAPLPTDNHQIQAVLTALEILQNIEINCGMGIASGDALAGTIGSSQRKEYTVIGDTVNTASRVEGLCKVFGSSLVVTSATFDPFKVFLESTDDSASRLHSKIQTRFLGTIRLKGKAEPVKVYDLFSKDVCYHEDFNNAINLYTQKEFITAQKLFEKLQSEYPNDKAILWYIEKCKIRQNSDQTDWDGVETMTEK